MFFSPPLEAIGLARVLAAVGAVACAAGLLLAPDSTWAMLLLCSFFGLCLGLAGTVFIALQYVTGAGWSVALRRVPEALSALLPVWALGLAAVLLLYPDLYPWFSHEHHDPSALRGFWLHWPFFLLRALVYVALWILLSLAMLSHSRRQDVDGLLEHTRANRSLAALFLVVFGVTFWLASYDWIMSLEPEWTSTVFGIYNFAGLFQSGLAVVILLVLWLARSAPFGRVVSGQHLHDLGKLLFAFSTFWMYIWLCQYMLIWYVNNPEETPYYVERLHGMWEPLFWANVALNWVIPFFVLLPAAAKRNVKVLANVAVVVVIGRCLDLFLMIRPTADGILAGAVEIGMVLGMAGISFLVIARALARAALVPVCDPFLIESLPCEEHVLRSRHARRAEPVGSLTDGEAP
jgi:hypothetical protein